MQSGVGSREIIPGVGNHPKTYLSKHPPELTASTSSTPQA
jgi:hypothetical protein